MAVLTWTEKYFTCKLPFVLTAMVPSLKDDLGSSAQAIFALLIPTNSNLDQQVSPEPVKTPRKLIHNRDQGICLVNSFAYLLRN